MRREPVPGLVSYNSLGGVGLDTYDSLGAVLGPVRREPVPRLASYNSLGVDSGALEFTIGGLCCKA